MAESIMNTDREEPLDKPKLLGVRHLQYFLLFTSTFVAYGVRIAFNVGIIAIVSSNPLEGVPTYPEWSSKKNVMLSSFFWGYIAPQVLVGELAKSYGAKWFLTGATLLGSVFSILIPVFAQEFGYQGIIFCRVLQGFGQSFLFPCVHTLLSKWTPINDRGKVGGFTCSSRNDDINASDWIAMLAGLFFTFFGALGIAWTILFAFLGTESPSQHKSISEIEKNYIEHGTDIDTDNKKLRTPWKAIFTSLPFWAILICHCGENWGYWTLLTEIPSFLDKNLKFDIASNSLLSALPYFVFWILSFVMGATADFFIRRKVTSVTASRKIFTSVAMFVPVVALLSITFIDTQRFVIIFLLVLSVGATAGIFCGYYINHIDLSPNYAGALMGFTTMVSNISSLLAPLSVDLIIYITGYQETDRELWNIVFYIASIIYLVTGCFYIYGGSGDVQSWNTPKERRADVFNYTNDRIKDT
ncbi:hypothetical protein NQ317_013421 [Molorchus minor]|uniref:Major facilitator superfamily (MFS) profile domain-containing protein n=1 Tax=Molorchus minor TaxID=1323400 RepID=A0ABQ9JSW6_9CUCU|nr:hypothetical protein NQ317_013421 [Molorchus minor]